MYTFRWVGCLKELVCFPPRSDTVIFLFGTLLHIDKMASLPTFCTHLSFIVYLPRTCVLK